MTTATRDAVLAVAREHMDKEAGIVSPALNMLRRAFGSAAGSVGKRLSSSSVKPVSSIGQKAVAAGQNATQKARVSEIKNLYSASAPAPAPAPQTAFAGGSIRSTPPSQGTYLSPSTPTPIAPSSAMTPGSPAAPTELLSPSARRYATLAATGIGGGALLFGGSGGAQAGMNQQATAPTQYPPGY